MWLRGALLACISYLRETRVGNNSAWPATIGKPNIFRHVEAVGIVTSCSNTGQARETLEKNLAPSRARPSPLPRHRCSMLGSRSTTPSAPQCIYLTVAAALPREGLLPRLLSRLREYGGEAVSCGPELDRLVREEVGAADAVGGAAAARRLSAIDGAELVVAEISEADATVAAEVMYALHRRRVPTLCLWRRECESAFTASLTGDAAHPLLTTGVYSDEAEAEALIDAFAAPPEMPGRIFVVEGGDGAGKQTQYAVTTTATADTAATAVTAAIAPAAPACLTETVHAAPLLTPRRPIPERRVTAQVGAAARAAEG